MKGFVYLIEIAAAALLIVGAIGVLSMFQGGKVFWERPELVSVGNSMIRGLEQNGTFDNFLSYPYVLSDIEAFKPPNVVYGIRVSGTFPSIINIGCASGCASVRLFLSDSYVNNRRIKFSVTDIDLASITVGDMKKYDVIAFYDYDTFDADAKIQAYINSGGAIVAITDVTDITKLDDTFDLAPSSATPTTLRFTDLDYKKSKISKYFFGFGFTVLTPDQVLAKKRGSWVIWEVAKEVLITETTAEIQGVAGAIPEGGTFTLTGPNGAQTFKVKKILWPDSVIIQPLGSNFYFNSFTADQVNGRNSKNVVSNSANDAAGVVANRTAVWISKFPNTDEDITLFKSAIASVVNEWSLLKSGADERVEVPAFVKQCCDMPETVQIDFILSYAY